MHDFGLSQATIQMLKEFWGKYPEIVQVKIYGSRAKGNYRKGSDIDFAVWGTIDDESILKISGEIDQLPLPYKFDVTHYESIENPELKAHIDRVGVVFAP